MDDGRALQWTTGRTRLTEDCRARPSATRTAVLLRFGRFALASLPTLPGTDGTIGRLGTLDEALEYALGIDAAPEATRHGRVGCAEAMGHAVVL